MIQFSFYFVAAKDPSKPVNIVYVPSHLYHMLFELFKVSNKPLHMWLIMSCQLLGHSFAL